MTNQSNIINIINPNIINIAGCYIDSWLNRDDIYSYNRKNNNALWGSALWGISGWLRKVINIIYIKSNYIMPSLFLPYNSVKAVNKNRKLINIERYIAVFSRRNMWLRDKAIYKGLYKYISILHNRSILYNVQSCSNIKIKSINKSATHPACTLFFKFFIKPLNFLSIGYTRSISLLFLTGERLYQLSSLYHCSFRTEAKLVTVVTEVTDKNINQKYKNIKKEIKNGW